MGVFCGSSFRSRRGLNVVESLVFGAKNVECGFAISLVADVAIVKELCCKPCVLPFEGGVASSVPRNLDTVMGSRRV